MKVVKSGVYKSGVSKIGFMKIIKFSYSYHKYNNLYNFENIDEIAKELSKMYDVPNIELINSVINYSLKGVTSKSYHPTFNKKCDLKIFLNLASIKCDSELIFVLLHEIKHYIDTKNNILDLDEASKKMNDKNVLNYDYEIAANHFAMDNFKKTVGCLFSNGIITLK